MDISVRRFGEAASQLSRTAPKGAGLASRSASGALLTSNVEEFAAPSDAFEPSTVSVETRPGSPNLAGDRYFRYSRLPLKDLRGSVEWSPESQILSGTEANQIVTSDYHQLGAQMRSYMAGDPNGPELPAVADFANLAKFGSRLGGDIIRDLENVMKADPLSLTSVARDMANRTTLSQGMRMATGSLARNLKSIPTAGVTGAAIGAVSEALRTKGKLRNVMVLGNTTIHDSASRAYDAFLQGESRGEDGLEGLKQAGYYPGSAEDPLGMYTEAFSRYKDARELGLQAQKETDPSRQEQLLARRDELVKAANIRLFIHEQMLLENPVMYGDRDIKNAVGSLSGSMVLKDAHGEYRLLPEGGNWTDFKTRMGFEEVAEGSPEGIRVPSSDGTVTTYRVLPDAVGTVSHYSNSRSAGPLSKKVLDTLPPPLIGTPMTATGKAVENIGLEWVQGSLGGIAAEATVLPVRVGADMLSLGGEWLCEEGTYKVFLNPATKVRVLAENGTLLDHVGLSVMSGLGALEQQTGQDLKAIGACLNRASKYAAATLKAAYTMVGPAWLGAPLF